MAQVLSPSTQDSNDKTVTLLSPPGEDSSETHHEEEDLPELLPTKRRAIRRAVLGMVWNANHVLEQALNPKTRKVPQRLFRDCHGIVLLTMIKAGFLVTGHAGTGVMMAKDVATEEWSPPVAVYNAGYSIGAVGGKKSDNVIIFLSKCWEEYKKKVKLGHPS